MLANDMDICIDESSTQLIYSSRKYEIEDACTTTLLLLHNARGTNFNYVYTFPCSLALISIEVS